MRPAVALLLACLALAACGGTERKTVIVNPPPNSTTVVDRDGNAHVIPNDQPLDFVIQRTVARTESGRGPDRILHIGDGAAHSVLQLAALR